MAGRRVPVPFALSLSKGRTAARQQAPVEARTGPSLRRAGLLVSSRRAGLLVSSPRAHCQFSAARSLAKIGELLHKPFSLRFATANCGNWYR